GHWEKVDLTEMQAQSLQPDSRAPAFNPHYALFGMRVPAADGSVWIFDRLHFYRKASENAPLVQMDQGLNPLAFYPFWSGGWYQSPGSTLPRVDPRGRIWIS